MVGKKTELEIYHGHRRYHRLYCRSSHNNLLYSAGYPHLEIKRDQGFLAGDAPALCSGDAPLDCLWDLDQLNSHHRRKYRYFWAGSHPSLDEGQIPVIRIFYSRKSAVSGIKPLHDKKIIKKIVLFFFLLKK